jgi:CHASE3 domain sensor protein
MFTRSFFSNQQSQAESIQELEEAVAHLTLENQQVNRRLLALENLISHNQVDTNQTINLQEEEIPATVEAVVVEDPIVTTNSNQIVIGSRVRIKNPKKRQTNKGIVVGFTPSGFAKIELNHNQGTVRRLPSNLKLLTNHD